MNKEKIQQDENQSSNLVEDLTLKETEASIKGGHFVADHFSFGVEREMK